MLGPPAVTIGRMTSTTPTEATVALPLRPGRWALDFAHSNVGFAIRHLGVAKVRGRYTRFSADVVVGDTPETSSIVATVDLTSVDTGNPDRDAHVQAPDIVDVAVRSSMTFRSASITGSDDRWMVDGHLTIGEITKPFRLEVELGGVADFPLGGPRHAGVTATGEMRRSDYGIAPSYPAPVLGDVVKVELDLELLEPEA
jgi:polyisoprenoid-binding protein YceI